MSNSSDYSMSNQPGANWRIEMNATLGDIQSNNSGATAPTTIVANKWWMDTTTGALKIRNAGDTAWLAVFDPTITTYDLTNKGLTIGTSADPAPFIALENSTASSTWKFYRSAGDMNLSWNAKDKMKYNDSEIISYTDFKIEGKTPRLAIYETAVTADQGKWSISSDLEIFSLSTLDDAETSGVDVFTIDRGTGTAVSSLNFKADSIFEKALRLSKGDDVASASALPLLADGNFFDVTGAVTITSIDTVAVGTEVTLQFDGAPLLTHHATNLIMPGGVNYQTTAGDIGKFFEYAPGDWVCTSIQSTIGAGTGDALVANPLSQFASTTSAQLAGVMSDETGTGALVFANAPVLVNPTGEAGAMTVARIAGSTHYTVQHVQDIFHSTGVSGGGSITDDADGTITVSAGTGFIRATDSSFAEILFFDWASEAGANVALVDADMNYLYVEYNAGAPQVIATITKRTDENTNIYLGTVYRDGTTLHITDGTRVAVGDHAFQMVARMRDTQPFARVSGGIISETGTRNIAITAGDWWEGLENFATPAIDTSGAGVFSYYYDDGVGGWTTVASSTVINNTQYDDGSGALATLSNSKYGVHWVYIAHDGELYVVYGTTNGSLTEANDAGIPASLPPHFAESHARIVGKVIIKKSEATFASIQSVFNGQFSLESASDHGGLTGLADDDHTQYKLANTETLIVAVSDETTAITTGTAKLTFRMPNAFTLSAVRASVGTAPTGAVITVDINETGTTILSTKLTIDATEKTSTTAATPAVISDANLADDAEITIDIDTVGSTIAGAGLKVYLIGTIPR